MRVEVGIGSDGHQSERGSLGRGSDEPPEGKAMMHRPVGRGSGTDLTHKTGLKFVVDGDASWH